MKTRDKIVHTALALFNQHGERNVTTNHIAEHLGISPGNLYYHFSNKQEIIREVFALYSQELMARFAPLQDSEDGLMMLKGYLDSTFALMWQYRFFYANLPEILSRDAQLHGEYVAVQEQLQGNLNAIMQQYVSLNLLRVSKDETQVLVSTLHLIACSWLAYRSAMSLHVDITEQVIKQGVRQILHVIKPVTTEQGYQQLLALEQEITA